MSSERMTGKTCLSDKSGRRMNEPFPPIKWISTNNDERSIVDMTEINNTKSTNDSNTIMANIDNQLSSSGKLLH